MRWTNRGGAWASPGSEPAASSPAWRGPGCAVGAPIDQVVDRRGLRGEGRLLLSSQFARPTLVPSYTSPCILQWSASVSWRRITRRHRMSVRGSAGTAGAGTKREAPTLASFLDRSPSCFRRRSFDFARRKDPRLVARSPSLRPSARDHQSHPGGLTTEIGAIRKTKQFAWRVPDGPAMPMRDIHPRIERMKEQRWLGDGRGECDVEPGSRAGTAGPHIRPL